MASSSESTTTSAKAESAYYQSKLGTVTILTLNNYPEFYTTVVPALMAAGWWRIISGDWNRTDENKVTWDQEAGRAIGLLNNSVIPAIRSTFQSFLVPTANPVGLWLHLKSYDTTANPVQVNNLRQEFDDFSFDGDVKIMEGVLKLQRLQTMLSGTRKQVSDEDLKSKLLSSLPSTEYWHMVKIKATEDQKDLNATITSLMSYQLPKPIPTLASIAASNTNRNQGNRNTRNNQRGGGRGARTRGRGGRNRGRGRGRGNSGQRGGRNESRDSGHEDKVQKDYSKDKLSPDQCAFCRKKGHYQADCYSYKRFQAQCLQEQEAKGDGKAQGNVAIATSMSHDRMSHDQIKDAGFPYLTVPHAMPSVTGHEYALHIANKAQSYLDSGATRHFSGIKSDFTQLKHWTEPEVVHVANGQTT
jgi:hypothetical protein